MNEQPEALRLADAMLNYWDERGPDAEAVAAELRRLHEANEAFGKRQEWWNDRMFELETALRQAVEALAAIEQAQEPVAWMYRGNLLRYDPGPNAQDPVIPLYAGDPL